MSETTVNDAPTPTSSSVGTQDVQITQASTYRRAMRRMSQAVSGVFARNRPGTDDLDEEEVIRGMQIEDYPPGYPQYCSLITAHNPYHICRRFTHLRVRLLLLKQDRLSLLEGELERIDHSEKQPLFLGNARRDVNPARKQIISDIEAELREYDELVERNNKILSYNAPKRRDVRNLKTWIDNSSSLATNEITYLSKPDLFSVGTPRDEPLAQVELFLEKLIMFSFGIFKKRPKIDLSRDPKVFIFSSPLLKRLTRGLIAWLVVVILLVPVIVINAVSKVAIRVGVIVVASAVVIMMLALMTKVKTWEMFLGGATYATVLVVFVPGNTGVM